MRAQGQDDFYRRISLVALIGITAAYCIWVMSLPLFPTGDGPMHLYVVHVFRALLGGAPSIYKQYYHVTHLLTPYAMFYYAELLFSMVVPELVAEKIVVCLYFILFAFGLRYLASAMGPNGHLMALAGTLLFLNWPLGMGFLNYCLALTLAMFAIGLWWRVSGKAGHRAKILFVALVYIVMLTHSIPLLFVLGFGFATLVVDAVQLWRQENGGGISAAGFTPKRSVLWQDLGYLLLASTTFLYVRLFTVSDPLRQTGPKTTIHTFSDNGWAFAFQLYMDFFKGETATVNLYRVALWLILLVPLALGLREMMRDRRQGIWTKKDTWVALCCLMIVVIPFVPQDLNQAYFFGDRIMMVIWLSCVLAGSIYPRSSRAFAWSVIGFSIAANALILTMAQARVAPLAARIAEIEQAPHHVGELGLFLPAAGYTKVQTLTYDPYLWAGVHYFRANDDVLFNTPWLHYAYIPVGSTGQLPDGEISYRTLDWPRSLRELMMKSPVDRRLLVSHVSFEVTDFAAGPYKMEVDPAIAMDTGQKAWSCFDESWFDLCSRSVAKAEALAAQAPYTGGAHLVRGGSASRLAGGD